MVLMHSPICDFGAPAPDFKLQGVDERWWTLADCKGPKGTLVMFICNHCPYVKAVRERLIRDTRELRAYGVYSVAISSNDPADYPEDGFDNMVRLARELDFPFPYLFDQAQDVARAYGAACTPDFFGYDAGLGLQYRGRLDASGREPGPVDAKRELFEAMVRVADTGHGPEHQVPSMGCSIKWRAAQ